MRICISGGTGFIGSNFCKVLSYQNHDVFCIVRNRSNVSVISEYVNCSIVRYDKPEDLYSSLSDIKPDCLIHFAGFFCSEHSPDNIMEMIECNLSFSTVLVDAAVSAGCRRIINTSSYWKYYNGYSYDPVNLYAATKKAFEDILAYYVSCYSCHVTTLTIFDTYGFGDQRKKVLNIIRDLPEGSSLDMSEGNQKMSFVYIDDVIAAFMQEISDLKKGVFEEFSLIADNEDILPLREIVTKLLDLSQKKIDIRWGAKPMRSREILDPRRIGTKLPGWRAKVGIDLGLKLFLGSVDK